MPNQKRVPDPVIDEVRAVRRRISARFDHNPGKLVEHYMELQQRHKDRLLDDSPAPDAVNEPGACPTVKAP